MTNQEEYEQALKKIDLAHAIEEMWAKRTVFALLIGLFVGTVAGSLVTLRDCQKAAVTKEKK